LNHILKVKERDVADNTTCRQQVDALHGLEVEEAFFDVLEEVHSLTIYKSGSLPLRYLKYATPSTTTAATIMNAQKYPFSSIAAGTRIPSISTTISGCGRIS